MLNTQAELKQKLDSLQEGKELPLARRAYGAIFGEGGTAGLNETYRVASAFAREHDCTLIYDEYDTSSPVVFKKAAKAT